VEAAETAHPEPDAQAIGGQPPKRTATPADAAPLGTLIGRRVRKKFLGSGFYNGIVHAAHESKPATYIIRWEDGVTKPMKATVVEKHLLPQD